MGGRPGEKVEAIFSWYTMVECRRICGFANMVAGWGDADNVVLLVTKYVKDTCGHGWVIEYVEDAGRYCWAIEFVNNLLNILVCQSESNTCTRHFSRGVS